MRIISRKCRERVCRSECLRICQMFYKLVCLILVWNFCNHRPEARNCFYRKPLAVFVKVVVEACVRVPHKRVDACLQREVHALVHKAQVFVVENVAHCRHVQCVYGERTVEINKIFCTFSRRVGHCCCGYRACIKAVFAFKSFFKPCHIFLHDGHNFFDALFVCRLVVKVVFNPSKKRNSYAFRIFL